MKKFISLVLYSFWLPAAVFAQVITNNCVDVPGVASGVVIGDVVAGQAYHYSASGCIILQVGANPFSSDPEGDFYTDTCSTFVHGPMPTPEPTAVCPGLTGYSLVGKLGGACLQFGTNGVFVAPTSGSLVLYLNDYIWGDNSGLWSVCMVATNATPPPPPPSNVVCVVTTAPGQHALDITRSSRFWFEHPESTVTNCATLLNAIVANGGGICIGFLTLPQEYRDPDGVKGPRDAMIEALGLYWRNSGLTGDPDGTQSAKLRGSKLCKLRKKLVVELIAAIANNVLLGTSPSSCIDPQTGQSFSPYLLELASGAAGGENLEAVEEYTSTLIRFNLSGVTNNFAGAFVQCDAQDRKSLKSLSRDPTTQITCPGINDNPDSATRIYSFPFKDSVDLSKYATDFPISKCGIGGPDAVWKIAPPEAAPNRSFTVDTFKSNIDTILSVWIVSGTNLTEMVCNDDDTQSYSQQSKLQFRATGSQTYYIVGSAKDGVTGKLKLHVTSP